MRYAHIISEVCRRPWAITPEKFASISRFLAIAASGVKFSEEEIRDRIEAEGMTSGPRVGASTPGNVALISIRGVIAHRMSMVNNISGPGGTSIEGLRKSFHAALSDPNVKAIVFDVESPGGSVDGVPELADEIYQARGQKKTIAVANTYAASAAYWLASAASEIVVTPSGAVGSIGVFAAHEDISKALETEGIKLTLVSAGKYKTEGNPYEPLSEEARAAIQSDVDAFYQTFVKAVARGRSVKQDAVRSGFGQGRMVMAADSITERMADRVGTLDEVLNGLGVGGSSQKVAASLSRARLMRELELHQ